MKFSSRLASLTILVLASIGAYVCNAESLYHLIKKIPVSGEGNSGALSIDGAARRLYSPHGNKIDVADLSTETITSEIINVQGVRAFVAIPKFGLGYCTLPEENKLGVVDLKSLKLRGKAKAGKSPTCIVYNSTIFALYTINSGDNSISIFEADDADPMGEIKLPGKPSSAVSDTKTRLIYCSLEDKNEIAVVDPGKRKIAKQWSVAPGNAPIGLSVDDQNHLLFVTCRNKLMLIVETIGGTILASVPLGENAESIAYDPVSHLVFSASDEGSLTIAQVEQPKKLTVVQTLKTEPGAKTLALDAETHKIYVGPETGKSESPAGQAKNSFNILVFGPEQTSAQ